jgi:hypothetical protein
MFCVVAAGFPRTTRTDGTYSIPKALKGTMAKYSTPASLAVRLTQAASLGVNVQLRLGDGEQAGLARNLFRS